ncbi:hypothetical protein MX054_004265 [Enterobacter cloacae]|uniref:LuxR C-terminal-related transcriptional regulator n=1 Tax=Enterobacter bugandensis TaxID=881260 RepID=UPI0020064974|nr:LuxR C-terminal-related transcriptional regulator [Enterobacter bugandensis]EJC0567404.1 hypothetical protein [Enterobacter cloacae]MCK6898294.1 LuxR family transcriptional regulator [Enterobacter bugandensis]
MKIITKCNFLKLGLRDVLRNIESLDVSLNDTTIIDMRFFILEELKDINNGLFILLFPNIHYDLPREIKRASVFLSSPIKTLKNEILKISCNRHRHTLKNSDSVIYQNTGEATLYDAALPLPSEKRASNLTKFKLSPAEFNTLENLKTLKNIKLIAEKEGVSEKTIYARLGKIKLKMKVKSLAQLIVFYNSIVK